MNLTELSKKIHENARAKGFYETHDMLLWHLKGTEDIEHALTAQKIALIHSELSEALEADREGYSAVITSSLDHCGGENNWIDYFKKNIKNTFEDELADVIIRVLDLCGSMDIDIQKHVDMKMKYNESREYKHGKNY